MALPCERMRNAPWTCSGRTKSRRRSDSDRSEEEEGFQSDAGRRRMEVVIGRTLIADTMPE
jgi:hypothetical protein